jgi:hypothetical protein
MVTTRRSIMRENTFIPYLGSHEADAILSHPGATGQYSLPFLSTNGATPVSPLQPFSPALLQHALHGVDLHFSLDRDGDPVTVFAEDDEVFSQVNDRDTLYALTRIAVADNFMEYIAFGEGPL